MQIYLNKKQLSFFSSKQGADVVLSEQSWEQEAVVSITESTLKQVKTAL